MKKKVIAIIAGVVAVTAVVAVLLISFLPNKATKAVIEQINSIGTVSLSSESAINKALNDYNALTDKEKSKVSNYDILLDSQSTLKKLQDEENYQKVIELISALNNKKPESLEELKNTKKEIDILYKPLSNEYKEKVHNYDQYVSSFIEIVFYCIEYLSEEYKFDEATNVLNEYDELMTEEQHLKALSYIGRWKCFKVAFDKREVEIKDMFKGAAVRVTQINPWGITLTVEDVCEKACEVKILYQS